MIQAGTLLIGSPALIGTAFQGPYLESIVAVSLYVSLVAVGLSTLVGVPIGLLVGWSDRPGTGALTAVINTGMGFPSVVVGLVVLVAVSHDGPLGEFDLVFTKEAMILSQFVLATPVVTAVTLSAVTGVDQRVRETARALGGTRLDVALVTIKQARRGIATAILAGFGRAISEVGSVLVVGGNIASADGVSQTRTLTTAITFETRQGRYETAMVLGGVLLLLVFLVNGLVLRVGDGGVNR